MVRPDLVLENRSILTQKKVVEYFEIGEDFGLMELFLDCEFPHLEKQGFRKFGVSVCCRSIYLYYVGEGRR
jgi:hypothetical protein